MNAVIMGGGVVGFQIARQLIDEGSNVVMIEKDPAQAQMLASRLDCLVINDTGNNIRVLREAGTAQADVFIAVTNSDEMNLVACGLVARDFSVPAKIARVRSADYSGMLAADKPFSGVDYIVSPEIEAAKEVINSIRYGAVSDIILLQHSDLMIRNFAVQEDSPMNGITLRELSQRLGVPFLVALVVRGNQYIIPSGETTLREGDLLYITGKEEELERLFARLGKPRTEFRKILIIGGGRIASIVAERLTEARKAAPGLIGRLFRRSSVSRSGNLVIVDRDPVRCKELSVRFPEAVVINADISDEEIFHEERLSNSDLVIALTDNQELNIVTGLYAKALGIPRAAVLVNNLNYTGISAQLGIDVTVSLKTAIVNSILTIVRKGYIHSIHGAAESKIEALDFQVNALSRAAGKQLKEIAFPPDSLVISVSSGGETRIPDGSTVLSGDDHVVVIARQTSYERLLALFTEPS
jgi:trk system potassium uptake protein TrkA